MYLFIFGRNPELSKLELASVLSNANYQIIHQNDTMAVVNGDIDPSKLIDQLAGTVRIAKIYYGGEVIDEGFIQKLDFYFPKTFSYAINFLNLDNQEQIQVEQITKKDLKKYKARGLAKHIDSEILNPAKYFSYKLDEGFELFVFKEEGNYNFAQTLVCTDTRQYEYKDEARPDQKFTRGTSFRLARIMVNCLGLKKQSVIVDPFCGIGTFLIEGLQNGHDVIGIDNEKEMTDASMRNIKWAKKTYNFNNKYQLITDDSSLAEYRADACVFEPYMGPFLKKAPSYNQAMKIMNRLEDLYIRVFDNLYKNLSSKAPVVCVLPYMKTSDGKTIQLYDKFFKTIKFEFDTISFGKTKISNPIDYSTPDGSKIGRKIYKLKRKV